MSIDSTNLIGYRRVSTQKQGRSGLGLEAQEAAIAAHLDHSGGKLLASYTEVESGRRNDRPELAKALAHAKRSRATIVIAKFDRLSRNLAFLSALMESGVTFVACDNPHANRLTIHLLAAIAQHEAEIISERVRAALEMLKRRGVLLGSARPGHWEGREDRRRAGSTAGALAAAHTHRSAATAAYADLRPLMAAERARGCTLQQIADKLNADGHTTRTGRSWNHVQVGRVLAS